MSEGANINCVFVNRNVFFFSPPIFCYLYFISFLLSWSQRKAHQEFFFLTKLPKSEPKPTVSGAQLSFDEWSDAPSAAKSDIKPPPSIPAPRVTPLHGRSSAGLFIWNIGTETGPDVCEKKFLRHPQMAVGEDWGPEDLTGAHPAILKKKKNGRKKKQKGKKKKRSALLEEREASLGLSLWISQE